MYSRDDADAVLQITIQLDMHDESLAIHMLEHDRVRVVFVVDGVS